MAKDTPSYILITGAASTTQATAVSNLNSAVATFLANANNAIYDPSYVPQYLNSGFNAQAASDLSSQSFSGWAYFFYKSAS